MKGPMSSDEQVIYQLYLISTWKTDNAQKHEVFVPKSSLLQNQPCKVTDAIPQFAVRAWLKFSFFGTEIQV